MVVEVKYAEICAVRGSESVMVLPRSLGTVGSAISGLPLKEQVQMVGKLLDQDMAKHSMDKLLASHNALLAICRSNSELLRHLVTSGDDQLPNQPERTARTQKLIAAAEAASLA